jgi:hypothetical protein
MPGTSIGKLPAMARTRASSAGIPGASSQSGNSLVERFAPDVERLKVAAAGVRGAAEQDHAASFPGEPRLDGIEPHVGVDGDGIGTVSLERFDCIALGGGADVAALGIQNDGDTGVLRMNVFDQSLEFTLGAYRREIGDLGLECADTGGGGINDVAAKGKNCLGAAPESGGNTLRIRVQAHAEHRIGACPRLSERQ